MQTHEMECLNRIVEDGSVVFVEDLRSRFLSVSESARSGLLSEGKPVGGVGQQSGDLFYLVYYHLSTATNYRHNYYSYHPPGKHHCRPLAIPGQC